MGETYPYEELDGRRFQRLAQSLITAERPRTQCLPIAGPDGGRDAAGLDFDLDGKLSDAVIYQVKYREQNPVGIPSNNDLYDWVIKHLGAENKKLSKLKDRGAREFVFITNVPASGHLGTGLRDRVQQWVAENVTLPTFIWWREDIDARLDRNPALVFRFMLFRGPDSVQAYLAGVLDKSTTSSKPDSSAIEYSTRNPAISTLLLYLARQYEEESTLRFKQAHLDAPLIDSFVDVPFELNRRTLREHPEMQFRYRQLSDEFLKRRGPEVEPAGEVGYLPRMSDSFDGMPGAASKDTPGAASVLLFDQEVLSLHSVVIEAGPGQGKSTLVQFLGQIHRAKILGKTEDLARLPSHLSQAALRIPVRIELRHLGEWLQGSSPWSRAQKVSHDGGAPSLHGYIASHVRHVTGGMRFTNEDLIAIVSSTPTLLLLDGLDEVADISLRELVVTTVHSFVRDMKSLGAQLQVVATSRPSSLARAPIFARNDFLYCQLTDLSTELAEKYTNSWVKRRALPDDQASELRRVLAGCLTQPHISELARTPMQLAILLWLVHTRGWNLPDKRTALYEEYVRTVFDREADKSPKVRQYRDLLLEIHGHLGWLLHARSEGGPRGAGAGDIATTDLKRTIWEYLERKQEPGDDVPSETVSDVFDGIRRVFILVDRIQGKHEFQVQPLREFFAARHLYKTAPYHSNAVEVTGSRPERLEALLRSPYWLNVARFFCGSYDVGELADLVQRIEELKEDEKYRYSLHVRLLIVYLLRDYVTAASPKATRKLARLLTDPLSMRQLLADHHLEQSQGEAPGELIPRDSGLPALLDAAQSRYVSPLPDQVVYELARLIRQIPKEERWNWWLGGAPKESKGRDEWLRRGVIASCFDGAPAEQLLSIFSEDASTLSWVRCVEASRLDVALAGSRMPHFVDALMRGYGPLGRSQESSHQFLDYVTRGLLLTAPTNPLAAELFDEVPRVWPEFQGSSTAMEELGKLAELESSIKHLPKTPAGLARRADVIGEAYGEPWVAWRIAMFVAPIIGASSVGIGGESLSSQAAIMWKHRKALKYWTDHLDALDHQGRRMGFMAGLLAWAPADVITGVLGIKPELCRSIASWEFSRVRSFVQAVATQEAPNNIHNRVRMSSKDVPSLAAVHLSCLLSILDVRIRKNAKWDLDARINLDSVCEAHRDFTAGYAVSRAMKRLSRTAGRDQSHRAIQKHFPQARGETVEIRDLSPSGFAALQTRMTIGEAESILQNPELYPIDLLTLAGFRLEGSGKVGAITMLKVARDRRWFDQDL
ncbi:NACHT domain-containing protein [Streptomyces sp. NPDC048521]|uniref:NACHT domain-containing protein n=1 Tax=Streptomyces sp. NPDC048521 TaxID=3365566 RepID=UPI00371E01A9